MKPMEKILVVAPLLAGWILMWAFMPDDRQGNYHILEWVFFAATIVGGVVILVRWYSQHVQSQYSDRIKRALERHDRRTNR
jgi:MFS family permease